jgi:lysophospholipase L1-like esterase
VKRRLFVFGLLAFLAVKASADNSLQDGLPYVAGDFSIANQIIHGNANVLVVGDSIATDIAPYYFTEWKPDNWSGIVVGPNLGSYQLPVSTPLVSTWTSRNGRSAAGPAGIATAAPGLENEYVFSGSTASSDWLSNRFYVYALDPSMGAPYAMTNQPTGQLTITPLVYGNPNGVANGAATMTVVTGGSTVLNSEALGGMVASTPTINSGGSVTISKQVWNDPNYPFLSFQFGVTNNATPAANSNFALAGIRVTDGSNGFQLANIAQGGWTIEDFLSDTETPLANVQQFITLTQSNIAFVSIGANDLGSDNAATFAVRLQQLIDRYRTADPTMKFVFLATYDLNRPQNTEPNGQLEQQAFNEDMYEMSQDNSGVLFLDLYDKAENWSVLNSEYLGDGTHPNAAGQTYFADQEWNLLEQAAQTPEPTGVAVMMVCFGALSMKRRGRRSGNS